MSVSTPTVATGGTPTIHEDIGINSNHQNNNTNSVKEISKTSNNNGGGNVGFPQDKRLDIESMINEFNEVLSKEHWAKYARVISLFILGKLSRKELVNELDLLFKPTQEQPNIKPRDLIRLHNQLLLSIFTNSLRETTDDDPQSSKWGFQNGSQQQNKRRSNKPNSQIELYKKIVVSLPLSDRQRLKMITKEAGKRGFVLCSVLQARLRQIPKLPCVFNQETAKRIQQQDLKGPQEWSQKIMNGFKTQLSTESYVLPDNESLYLRMLGIARENGIVGQIDSRCVDIVSLALEYYLKTIIESTIDTVRYREKKYSDFYDLNDDGFQQASSALANSKTESDKAKDITGNRTVSITNEDALDSFTIFPNVVDPTGAYLGLTTNGLVNDDEIVHFKSPVDDLFHYKREKPNFTPLDEKNMGSREELNWLIKDILTKK
ncbi:Hfi1p [Kluyveromyces lactis]|uniref:KLLA0B10351p n=1 Tax=Kluyveromyces lactis (strain ATCC 8585 / CBS 2359 / DSM 70799 / NBRC 1267 / NRRL Y-1140 / WM37) TaxID=284590 RepID=Q6CVP9_KLULA|nr:uncharacterized protein KLLA0_B10351g [Kluyveromyces lactis]CAH02383.1 KLLA0B10351p [Kluyveromyces lactis]|eukprot:XP_451990.1 uncharacterized protein KLLA0_B10351g [Kluyveromyces lactis]